LSLGIGACRSFELVLVKTYPAPISAKKGHFSVILRLFLKPMLRHRLQKADSADEKLSSF
jgi:hypothetical protein